MLCTSVTSSDDMGGAALRLDLGAQFLQALDAAARQHDLRAGLRQHLRKALPEAARRAGDQRDLAFQIDRSTHLHIPFRCRLPRRMHGPSSITLARK
jgi:hypothetical protein